MIEKKPLNVKLINSFLKGNKKRLVDGMVKGLYLEKTKNNIVWRYRYKIGKKDSTVKIGNYPAVSLSVAREKARELTALISEGIDPQQHKKQKKEELIREQNKKTFKYIAYEFLELQKERVSEKRFKSNYLRAFEKYAIPFMGNKKIDEIKRNDLIEFIKYIPKVKLSNATRTQNKTHTAKEVFNYVKNCLDYALNLGMIEYNPAYGINPSVILPKEKKEKMKAVIDDDGIKEVYQKINSYKYEAGRYLMIFQALTVLRNTGLYRLKWEYIDWENKIITYPANTYKANQNPYRLPLTDTLIEILKYFKNLNITSTYVFREENIKEESISNRIRKYYQLLDIKEHTPHGWRSAFRSLARKHKAAALDTIELQLNHKFGDNVTAAYMRVDLIEERRSLLLWWESFLTSKEK